MFADAKRKFPGIYLLWDCFFAQRGKMKQREEQRASHFTIRGGRARFLHFQVLIHWILEVGAFSYRQTNFTWQPETSVHSARACWFLRNVPTENGGVRIFSGSLCRANFQPLSQKSLGDMEEGGGGGCLPGLRQSISAWLTSHSCWGGVTWKGS